MPLVKQTGVVVGARRNLNILCDVFLLSVVMCLQLLLTAPGCCAKIETQIKLLNDDYTVPTRVGSDEASADSQQQPTVPHYNMYRSDLQRISYETIHRILRDENEPMIYRTNDLRYFQKRSSAAQQQHTISKRSVMDERPLERLLNLTNSNLQSFSRDLVLPTHLRLQDITSIILHNNSLREFPLAAVPNLTVLDVSANNFTHFEVPSEKSQLRVLNLNANRIVNFTTPTGGSVSTESKNNNLRELHLKDNAMRELGQLNLSLLNELEILDLSCNQLENLETAFFPTRMRNLKFLNLARNRLQCIYRETFYNLLSMNTLILSYNEVAEIDYETFLALPNLQYLDLSHNQLRGDSIRALQGIPDLVGLSIAYNRQLGDSMQEFVASWSLKELDASGTGLCKIPAALAQSVRTLKLADNWLTIINCGDLDSYPLLQYLDLSHSNIDEIEEDALGRLEILETLFLDHNNLKRIPISLPTSLEHLFLHDNQIMDIQPQSFQGLNNLKTLDLSANKLLYLPDLPLPKLLTLNLQSSGINGLHQAIVKTSPHLRDLYLEDNPIKCADLLGIAEWASPCRNDRRKAERINIKSHYVQMHNYFERFQCGGNADTCSTCKGDVSRNQLPEGSNRKPNCVEVNGLGGLTTPAKPATEIPTQERKNNEDTTTTTTTEIPLTRKTYAESTTTSTTTDANQDEPKRTSNAPETTPAAQPEVSTPTTTPASRIQTNSTDKTPPPSPPRQQKQLAVASPSRSPTPGATSQIKSDNNYVETSAASRPPPAPAASLLSQENTDKSHKGLKAQSDNATKIGHSINGEISVATLAAKSNLPTTPLEETTTETHTTTIETVIPIRQIRKEKGSNAVPREQQHNKIQEILHTKDRHLIGTPLLMHKGHVVLVPLEPAVSVRTTPTTTSKENLLHLAPRQDAEGSSSTTITTSKAHKFEMVVDVVDTNQQYHHQQQGSNENAIIKGPKKKMTSSGPLGQENHYQDIQQTQQQQHKVQQPPPKKVPKQKQQNGQNELATDKKHQHSTTQQKSKETTPSPPKRKDKNQRHNNDNGRGAVSAEQDKQFASNLEVTTTTQQHHSSHSLNTPLDGQIFAAGGMERIFKAIDVEESASTITPTTHHSRVNTPLLKNEDDLQNLQANLAPQSRAMQSTVEGQTINRSVVSSASPAAALIKLETGPRNDLAASPPLQSIVQQQHTMKSERWLDIRKATRHPGLVVVIGVTFALVFVVGLVQVYRHRQKPLNYIGHRHYGYQSEQQYQDQDYQRPHHHHTYRSDNGRCGDANNHNQCTNYGCNDDRMQSPHHLLRIHEKPGVSSSEAAAPGSNYELQREDAAPGCASNRNTTSNYRLFQLNGRRIKHNHHAPSSLDDENDFYSEMNHGPQSVLPSDFFPMELLSAPSRIQSSSSSSLTPVTVPSSSLPPVTADAPSHPPTTIALVGEEQQRQSIDVVEFQDTAVVGRERSKFEIW